MKINIAQEQVYEALCDRGYVVALFCGSRHFDNAMWMAEDMDLLPPQQSVVIEGDAPGADRLARRLARARLIQVATVPAYWAELKKPAGRARNVAMTRLAPDICFAYPTPSSRGTPMMIALCRQAGIPTFVREALT